MTDIDLERTLENARHFPAQFQTLHLATCNNTGIPEASYAAYVEYEGSYYIYISELAKHCSNLKENAHASVLFIESEAETKHPFARQRLTLSCTASECERDSQEFEIVMAKFSEKFGNFMDMIARLSDFHLYQLTPEQGNFVAGFAKAFTLTGNDLANITHRNEQGHYTSTDEN